MIRKVKGGYVIIGKHGKDKGKRLNVTKKPTSKKHALKILRAIEASKHSK
jgi:hypothetical protein